MNRFSRMVWIFVLAAAIVGCSLLTNPVLGAQDLASTAEALATHLPLEAPESEGMPEIPGLPDVSAFLNPVGKPLESWRGIPIMPGASAGEEFDGTTYSYMVAGADGTLVEEYYDAELEALGWMSPVRTNVGTAGGYMLFTKGTSALNIMITKSEGEVVVLLNMP